MAVVQQGTLLLVTFCILTLWLTSTFLGCYEGEGDGAPPHHEGARQAPITSTPRVGGAKVVGAQHQDDILDNDVEYQRKLKDIILWFESEVDSIPVQPSCPMYFSEGQSTPSDLYLAAFGSFHLSNDSKQSVSLLTDIVEEVSSALPRLGSALVAQLGADFGGTTLDSKTASTLAGLLKSLNVSVLSVANNGVEGKPGKMDIWIQALHDSRLEWVGLQVRQSTLVNLNGALVGFAAFCTHYSGCQGNRDQPLSPAKYSQKAASEQIKDLKKAGATAIVVLMYWGKPHKQYPSEHTLSVARHFANLNVSLVLGDFPALSQQHAYFGKTFIVFSPGRLLVHESELCWQKISGQFVFMEHDAECQAVPPQQRDQLRVAERYTRVYHLTIKGGHAIAKYKTVPLREAGGQWHREGVLRPVVHEGSDWTPACGETDTNCLSCKPI